MKFQDCKNAKELKQELLKVLSNTGKSGLDDSILYHYTNITVLYSILKNGYIWLGRTDEMNDRMEEEYIQSEGDGSELQFTAFSRVEENMAMYKMYAPAPDGVMVGLSYRYAKRIIDEARSSKDSKVGFHIVRDRKVTDDIVEGDLYWAEVCYKALHTDELFAGDKHNSYIHDPLNNHDLAGVVKLYGWSYEKEIRLCASLNTKLDKHERIAVRLSDEILKNLRIVTCPDFNYTDNAQEISWMKRNGYSIVHSNYLGLVDLGFDLSQKAYISKLEKENQKLQKENDELKNDIYKSDKELFEDIVNKLQPLKYYLTECDLGAGINEALIDILVDLLEEKKDPLKTFMNKHIEKCRNEILIAIDNFVSYSSINMIYTGNVLRVLGEEECWKSPKALERYKSRVNEINRLASLIWDKYAQFVNKYKEKG